MKKTEIITTITILALLVLLLTFFLGKNTGKNSVKCPELTTDTIYKYDTVTHVIYKPYYHIKHDTTIIADTIPVNIDTAEVIQGFYAKDVFRREWEDSLINIVLYDTISQNQPIASQITYKLLKPTEIINNSVTNKTIYNRYLYGGASINTVDLKLSSLELVMANPRWYGAVGYMPGVKGVNLRAGITIFNFKHNGN